MDQRIKVSEANSVAIQGENEAKMKIAMSDAELKEKQAEALKIATTAEKYRRLRHLRSLIPRSAPPKKRGAPRSRPLWKPTLSSAPKPKSARWSLKPRLRLNRNAA